MGATVPVVDYLVLEGEPRLRARECRTCGALYLDRRNACAHCGKDGFTTRDLARTGVLRSFTVVHRGAPGVPTPYTSGVVELDGGGAVKANVLGLDDDPERIALNMRVRLRTFTAGTDDDGTEAVAFGFAPEEA